MAYGVFLFLKYGRCKVAEDPLCKHCIQEELDRRMRLHARKQRKRTKQAAAKQIATCTSNSSGIGPRVRNLMDKIKQLLDNYRGKLEFGDKFRKAKASVYDLGQNRPTSAKQGFT